MSFELPKLQYDYAALEPHIDARTMEIHHSKHHAGYTNNLNAAVAGTYMEGRSVEDLLACVSKLPVAVRNNGGGFYNHKLFWEVIGPNAGGKPKGDLLTAINRDFNSFESFQETFNKAAATRFGSGWAWLILQDGKLKVTSTANQDSCGLHQCQPPTHLSKFEQKPEQPTNWPVGSGPHTSRLGRRGPRPLR